MPRSRDETGAFAREAGFTPVHTGRFTDMSTLAKVVGPARLEPEQNKALVRRVIEDLIAEGDMVVRRGFFRGTHRGEFQGIPPTGNR